MGLILRLAAQSLRSRVLTTWLTITSIALSVTLLVGIEHLRAGVRESFAGTISGTDLIVGARGGSLQVLLSTVFGIGSPAGSVSMKTFERWKAHPAVKWAVPYTLGDSHRGFRVVGTTTDFFERYRFRKTGTVTFVQGRAPTSGDEVAIGADVEEKLKYALNAPVVVTHGLMDIGTSNHETHPFHVVGILARTFTPIDRSVYMTLAGVEDMHEVEQGRITPTIAAPAPETPAPATQKTTPTKKANVPAAMPGANPPVMPGATPPTSPAQQSANASAPPVMPGAAPPAAVVAAAAVAQQQAANASAPPVMPGASPPASVTAAATITAQQSAANASAPPVMPGASPPPSVAAAATKAQQTAASASAPLVMPGATPPKVVAVPPTAPVTIAQQNAPAAHGQPGHSHGDDQITAFFVGTK
ncbi:MAG: ABC transporter permease, partial [Gemmatimonadaceae bacterium]